MFEHRRRAMVGIALIVIFSALMGLLALSSGAGVFSELAFAAEPSIPPFAERLEEAGSLEALVSEAPDGCCLLYTSPSPRDS